LFGSRQATGATHHASCVSFGDRGVLITGPSGSGKSDLALRLITTARTWPGLDTPARLVADDRVLLSPNREGRLFAAPAPPLAGLLEVRGIGILRLDHMAETQLCLNVDLVAWPDNLTRLPDNMERRDFAGAVLPCLHLSPRGVSAEVRVLAALSVALGHTESIAGDACLTCEPTSGGDFTGP